MKKNIFLVIAVVTLLCGCGKTIPKLEDGKDAVVSFKDGSMISVDELYSELKKDYAAYTLVEMVDKKLLEDKYKDQLEDAQKYAENYIESLKTSFVDEDGNYDEAQLLSAIQSAYSYSTIAEFQEAVRINYLRNLAVEDYVESIITDKEIKKYYKDEIVGDREVYHIEIIPEVKDTMTNDEKTEAENDALEEAKAIIVRLKKGEKFEDLAKEYSDDESTKENGGYMGYLNKGDYGYDEFDEEVYSLEVGDYSKTPVKTSKGYEIIYVKSAKDKPSLEDSKEQIIETLRDEKMSEDSTYQITGIVELRKEYGFEIEDSEIEKNYNNYIDTLIANAKANDQS